MSLFKRPPRDDAVVERQIRQAIVDMRPLLRIDAVQIELVEFDAASGVAVLRFEGDCPDCRMHASVLREGIEAHLRMHVPEIRGVRAI